MKTLEMFIGGADSLYCILLYLILVRYNTNKKEALMIVLKVFGMSIVIVLLLVNLMLR